MRYYYDDGTDRKGPVSLRELEQLSDDGILNPDSWIRKENASTWRRMKDTDFENDEPAPANGFLTALSPRQKLWLIIGILLLAPLVIVGAIIFFLFKALVALRKYFH